MCSFTCKHTPCTAVLLGQTPHISTYTYTQAGTCPVGLSSAVNSFLSFSFSSVFIRGWSWASYSLSLTHTCVFNSLANSTYHRINTMHLTTDRQMDKQTNLYLFLCVKMCKGMQESLRPEESCGWVRWSYSYSVVPF